MPFDQWKNLELPYDYRSVMHFGSRQLSQHGTMSMVKKDGTEIIPNKLRPTSLDIAKICAAYECSEACGNRWATCNNGEPLFVHRRCDGWLDCEDESDEEGCTDTQYTSCCKQFEVSHYNTKEKIRYTHSGTFNGRMAYTAADATHGKYLYFRQGKWAVGDTLGGQIAWYWTDDAQLNAADVFQNFNDNNSGGEKNIEDMKPNMFDEACPDGLEFRSTINARAWFKLDTCVDGKLSCHGCDDPDLFAHPSGNTDKPIKIPHNPTHYTTKAPPMEKPDAPTLPPHIVPALSTCKLQDIPLPKGGAWTCTGKLDYDKTTDDSQYWKAGSFCEIKCKGGKRVGICGPIDKYPMDDPAKQPGIIRCLSTGKWDYYPICKCQNNDCKTPKSLFTKASLKTGASYQCSHLDFNLRPQVEKEWTKGNPLDTICKPQCPDNMWLECHGIEPKTKCVVGNKSYKPKFNGSQKCECIGKCGHPQNTLAISKQVIVPCTDVDKFCHVQCPIWQDVQWELRYGTMNMLKWDGWLECKCTNEGKCEWNTKGRPANEFIHCVTPGSIRRDGHANETTTE